MITKSDLHSLVARSLQTEEPPAYVSTDQVSLRSEPLTTPIYWTGTQWAVTGYGVECRDGTYSIPANRVWEENGGRGWVQRMKEKDWVKLPDFVEALRLSRQRWPENKGGTSL
jgi:hypothetical protein